MNRLIVSSPEKRNNLFKKEYDYVTEVTDPEKFPNSLELIENTVSLPIYPSLSNDEVLRIISAIKHN